jgi:alpha-methylacyl-CoA racemase
VVDAAIVDGTAHLTTMAYGMLAAGHWRDERGRNLLDSGAPFYDVYATADGGYVSVGALEPKFYAELIRLLGLDDGGAGDGGAGDGAGDGGGLPDRYDVARWPELRRRFAEAFARRTRGEWMKIFEGSDACVAPVLSLAEAPEHPHLAGRGTFARPDGVLQPAAAPRFSVTPTSAGRPPPAPGRHSAEILAGWGIGDVDGWLACGAVHRLAGD